MSRPPGRSTRRWLIIGTREHGRVPLVPTFNKNHFEVQIIGHRNGKEEKQERTSQPGRFLKRTAAAAWFLAHRNDPPRQCRDQGDRKPEKVKELLHYLSFRLPANTPKPALYILNSILAFVCLGRD